MENKTKARCDLGDKAMKTKQTNMVRKREKRKNRNTKLNRGI